MHFEELLATLQAHADPDKAVPMRRYMRDQFEFLGIPTPKRRQLSRKTLRNLREAEEVQWDFVDACWGASYREFQYVASDYLVAVSSLLGPGDLVEIKRLAQWKPWWDTIDNLDGVVGNIVLAYPEAKQTMVEWSLDDDFWVRRLAIDHQLGYKALTDKELLKQVIVNNLGHSEFFVNKAIGWALREYSKTDPEWVNAFLAEYNGKMSALSVREGSKILRRS